MKKSKSILKGIPQILIVIIFMILYVVPFVFIVFHAGKTPIEAAVQGFAPPEKSQYIENFIEVYKAGNFMLLRGFKNSILITVVSILLLIISAAMAAFILERRKGRTVNIITSIILAGLMIPPTVVTTIWLLQLLGLYKTLPGIILIEIALSLPFSIVLFRGFMTTIPRELDEAAFMEGAGTWMLFSKIIFPLLKPVSVSVIVLSTVQIFNDFVNPLYFLPGTKNITIQLTLYNFMSRYSTQYNLLFMNILVISIPPLLAFIFFNKKIIGGMVSGAVKG